MRGLIDAKKAGADKEREAVQKMVDSLAVSTSTLESTSIPLTRKEIEVLSREIKRQEQNFTLVNKKIGLSKKGSTRVADMIRANEDTLLSQKTELSVIKKAVEELHKEERALVIEEKCGVEHLNQMHEELRVSSKFRSSMPPCMVVSSLLLLCPMLRTEKTSDTESARRRFTIARVGRDRG